MQKYCIANTFLIPWTLYLSQKLLRHPYPVSSWGITFKENAIQLCHFPQKRHLRISPSLTHLKNTKPWQHYHQKKLLILYFSSINIHLAATIGIGCKSVNNNLLTSNYTTDYFVFSELDSRIIIATTCQTEQSC